MEKVEKVETVSKEFFNSLRAFWSNDSVRGYLFKAVKLMTHGNMKLKGKPLTQEQFEDLQNAIDWSFHLMTVEEAEKYYYKSSLKIENLK